MYGSPQAFRMALEQRLLTRSNETEVSLDRLRRRVLLERIVARLQSAEPGRWVLKGGMALEVRLRDDARLTKDIDLGLRDDVAGANALHERLIDALAADPDGDRFVFSPGRPEQLLEDGGGHLTWRVKVAADLAGKAFGGVQLDVSPRAHELEDTDMVTLPNSLDFAGIPAPAAEIVDVHRHAAEKLHAMSRDFGDRENSRVRDLVDVVILIEHDLLDPARVGIAAKHERSSFRRADSGPGRQLLGSGQSERTEAPEIGQKLGGEVERADTSGTVSQHQRHELTLRESFSAARKQSLSRSFV